MKRGDIVIVTLPGDSGKPRPAVVLIADDLSDSSSRLVVLPFTTTLMDWPIVRVTIVPSAVNGLQRDSQIMIDRVTSVAREKSGQRIGQLSQDDLSQVDQKFLGFIGLT